MALIYGLELDRINRIMYRYTKSEVSWSTRSKVRARAGQTDTHRKIRGWLNCEFLRYAVVKCEIKLFQNYFSLCRRPSETILPENVSK